MVGRMVGWLHGWAKTRRKITLAREKKMTQRGRRRTGRRTRLRRGGCGGRGRKEGRREERNYLPAYQAISPVCQSVRCIENVKFTRCPSISFLHCYPGVIVLCAFQSRELLFDKSQTSMPIIASGEWRSRKGLCGQLTETRAPRVQWE